MGRFTFFLGFVSILCIGACNKVESSKSNKFFDFKSYFLKEIKSLDSLNPKFNRIVSVGGEPTDENMDSIVWKDELALFTSLDMNQASVSDKYRLEIDSSGKICIQHFLATDTNLYISGIHLTKVNGEIQLIEASLKKRSFIVDRDISLSYQPLKGYGIRIDENYIWGAPSNSEIFNQLEAPTHLKQH